MSRRKLSDSELGGFMRYAGGGAGVVAEAYRAACAARGLAAYLADDNADEACRDEGRRLSNATRGAMLDAVEILCRHVSDHAETLADMAGIDTFNGERVKDLEGEA